MHCRTAREQLVLLTAGERLGSVRLYLDVVRHCLGCAECRAAFRRLKRSRQVPRHLPAPPPPPALRARVLGALPLACGAPPVSTPDQRAARSPQWRLVALSGAGAVAVLVVALALVPGRRGDDAGRGKGVDRDTIVRLYPPAPSPRRRGGAAPLFLPGQGQAPPRLRARERSRRLHLPSPFRGGAGGGAAAPPDRRASDLVELNGDGGTTAQRWTTRAAEEGSELEAGVRRVVPVRDEFVQIPFPRLVSTSDLLVAQAVEDYRKEAAIVDTHLAREVTLRQKATALADLCERLRSDTGIQLSAGQSVADEKVTLFCEKMPLRDVMRQLSRPFGYTWLRSGKTGEYRYELVQDLRSQLLEEELRNRDRNGALLALERDIERYRPYLGLSPDEALAREKSAPPGDKRLFECLAREGWGPIHMYYRLSRQDMEALRAGQTLIFKREPSPGERLLPSDLERGVLQSVRQWRLQKFDDAYGATLDLTDPRSLALTAVPEVHGQVQLGMSQSELGQFTLWGNSGFLTSVSNVFTSSFVEGPLATGRSPAALKPDNAAANAALAHDAALRGRVTLQPQPTCRPTPPPDATEGSAPEPKVITADALELLHRATGLPIVADHYTRLYKPEAVSVRNTALFDALNHLTDAMRLRWNKDAGWLQFRSASYYHDRLKEVPNRLLARWSAARRRQGILTLDDLVEIAQLPDAQLDGAEMAEGAKECFGLAEWELLRDGSPTS